MSKIVIRFCRKGKLFSSNLDIVVYGYTNRKLSNRNFIEKLGYYNTLVSGKRKKELVINFHRLGFWLNRGAKLHKNILKFLVV